MDRGRIILDFNEEEKKELTIEKLLQEFEKISGHKLSDDKMVFG